MLSFIHKPSRGNAPRQCNRARPLAGALLLATLLPATAGAEALLVRCGALIDGVSDTPHGTTDVLIEQGRFTRIGASLEAPAGTPVLDLENHTCLPGLVEMHTHILEGPEELDDLTAYFDDTLEETLVRGRNFARATLESGVTTARDLGSYYGWAARELRDEIDRGETSGPRLLVAGYYLTIPGGGGDLLAPDIEESDIPAHMRLGVSRSAAEFAANAQAAVDGGADVIKLIASGAVLAYGGVPGAPEMSPAEIRAVVEVAHAAGLKVAAHAHGAKSIIEAIEAGADTIEHATYIDEEGIRLAIEHDVALSMEIGPGDWMIEEGRKQGWVEEFLEKTIETTDIQRESFRRAHAAGVPMVFGTDAGIYPHGMAGIQFAYMVEYGMTPMEAIQAATSVAAKYLGWEDRVGAVQAGRYGDLIAVAGNPLADIRLLESVDVVIKGGEVFKAAANR
jgi:imidazolonepropionase-like amidohydrolase